MTIDKRHLRMGRRHRQSLGAHHHRRRLARLRRRRHRPTRSQPPTPANLISAAKRLARSALTRYAPERLYPTPASALQPERLYGYLDALWQRRDLDGAILEIGCWMGGTAAIAERMLRRTGHPKHYVCVDTFNGFVNQQFDHDQRIGTPARLRTMFTDNSQKTVARLLKHYGAQVELVEGDIATVSGDRLPDKIAVCLLDVDLEIPTYEGLLRVKHRLVPGGLVIVDDCPPNTTWVGARVGYERFMREHNLEPEYAFGCGLMHD